MKTYIGTKIIHAQFMTRGAYNAFRGWEVPADENPADAGFLVEYLEDNKANVSRFSSYVSWSPADVFGRVYRPAASMTFGDALAMLKAGKRVARAGWNGKGMSLYLMERMATEFPCPVDYLEPCVVMITAQGKHQPGWLASQSDMLAEDWTLVN